MCVYGTNKCSGLSNWGSPNPKSITSLGLQPPREAKEPSPIFVFSSPSSFPQCKEGREGKLSHIFNYFSSLCGLHHEFCACYPLCFANNTLYQDLRMKNYNFSLSRISLKIMGLSFQIVGSLMFSKNPFRN